jgi:hypothetical protein
MFSFYGRIDTVGYSDSGWPFVCLRPGAAAVGLYRRYGVGATLGPSSERCCRFDQVAFGIGEGAANDQGESGPVFGAVDRYGSSTLLYGSCGSGYQTRTGRIHRRARESQCGRAVEVADMDRVIDLRPESR